MSKWPIQQMTGYEPISTFWEDFEIAEYFGIKAVDDTYIKCFEEWKSNYKMITELCMVINWRCWLNYDLHNKYKDIKFEHYAKYYKKKYYELDDYCLKNLKGIEFEYYVRTTD